MTEQETKKQLENKIDVHVGERIEIRRKLLKMTQKDLSKKIGVTFQQLQKYEQGFNRVSASRLWLISQALGTDINFFFEGLQSETFGGDDVMQQQKTLELIMATHGSLLFMIIRCLMLS